MKHIFVINPTAGKTDASREIQSKLQDFSSSFDISFYETKSHGDATEYVRSVCESTAEPVRFYACGGDGTLNEVVNGAVGFAHASVGCYPCGSGNDFVKYYGGEKRFLNLEAQLSAPEEEIDLIRVGDQYAINATHFGFDSCVAKVMNDVRHRKIIGGNNSYKTGVIVALVKAMKNDCAVVADGKLLNPKGKILLCTIANGQYVGGSYKCAPRSSNQDGLLEVCLVHPISRLTFVKLMKSYQNGTHLDDPRFTSHIVYCRAASISVTAPDGFVYSMDGELYGQSQFTVEAVPRAIRFAVPELQI